MSSDDDDCCCLCSFFDRKGDICRCCLLPLSPVSCPAIERERGNGFFPPTVEGRKGLTSNRLTSEGNLNQNSVSPSLPLPLPLKTTFFNRPPMRRNSPRTFARLSRS